tara:strand:+ start:22554 stop:23360 length:807 start_codon:yes stop_codon:yes gene_type:complete
MNLKTKNCKKIFTNKAKWKDGDTYPKITIITVVKNGEKFLEETIQSVINQTYKNFEYIIIDGYSNDNTSLIVKKYRKNINLYLMSKDKNMWDAMNKGIHYANGSIVVFLNSDDTFNKKALSYAAKYFVRDKQLDFLFGTVKKHWLKYGFYPTRAYWSFDFYTTHSIGFFIKKRSQLKIGNYNINFLSADLDLFLRMILKFKLKGKASKKGELFGKFRLGGFSSKVSYRKHLIDLNKIRLNNNQNKFYVYLIYLYKILKNPKKYILDQH